VASAKSTPCFSMHRLCSTYEPIIESTEMELAISIHVEHLPEGVYLATSDELPGLVAQGRTVADALEIAHDVPASLSSLLVSGVRPICVNLGAGIRNPGLISTCTMTPLSKQGPVSGHKRSGKKCAMSFNGRNTRLGPTRDQ
jgi:hypothetical protein